MTKQKFRTTYSRYKLVDLLKLRSTNQMKKILKRFSCSINVDLQDFLHNKAITFERNLRSRTYIYADNQNKAVVGYFTIAINYLEAENLEINIIEYLNGHTAKTKALPCYLLGQIAISDEYRGNKIGKFLLDDALEIIDETQGKFGGRFVLIDSVNDKKVIDFYHKNSFVEIQKDANLKSIKMIKPYF